MAEDKRNAATATIDPDLARRYRDHEARRGYHFSTFEWLAARDPEFERARLPIVEATYLRKDAAVPVKYKELVAAAILAYRGYPSVGRHLKRAMQEGATVREVIEVLEVASVPGGMPTLHCGIDHLIELEREHPELFDNA